MNRFAAKLAMLMSNPYVHTTKLSYVISIFLRFFYATQISPGVRIGKNFKLGYGGLGVVIHGGCTIGDNVTIGQNVTLGGNLDSGVPSVGNDVYIATGAKVLGSVIIGDGALVGANSVVLGSVEENSVVAGVPAKIIRYRL